jgi:hypothetical protein
LKAQNAADTIQDIAIKVNADDPSQFFTRIEVFNELQHYNRNGNDFYVNQTIFRAIVKVGKRFTTRVELPLVNNSIKTPTEQKSFGIGDISFRLLGYKFFERPKSAFTASLEVSMNTAQSRLLGTGKNILVPVVSYTLRMPEKKMLASVVLQQANSVSGDETRETISFSKIQFLLLKPFSKRTWMVLAPEWYIDYRQGGLSMNMRSRFAHAPSPRINIWISPSAGIFGDFPGRYQWSIDAGGRYFLFRERKLKKS